MKKTLLCIYAMLLGVVGYAQKQGDIPQLPNLIPPSPTAYELGKYGEVQVGHFTGTVQPSVPLTVYKTNNLQVPINLSYNASGIKVDQLTSNVGLGWSLNIGGVISRTVRGKPDENRTSKIPESVIGNYADRETIRYFESFAITNNRENLKDTSIDVFNYNFLGHSGQFILDNDKNIVPLIPKGLQIAMTNDGFTITDTLGVLYYFTVFEKTANRTYGQGHNVESLPAKTAWYLTKIIHPKGDEIYLAYESDAYTYDSNKAQSLTVLEPFYQVDCKGSILGSNAEISRVSTTMIRVIGGKKLKRITNNNDNTTLVIKYKNNPDVGITNLVDEITLSKESEIEAFTLKHLITNKNRVFLEEVIYKDPSKKYVFQYKKPELLPERMSFSQDHWGFYNGKNNLYFFPNPSKTETFSTALSVQNIGADKEIDPIVCQYGILEEIEYPTKGISKFTYENHSRTVVKDVYPDKTLVSISSGDFPGPPPPGGTTLGGIQIDESGEITTPNYEQDIVINAYVSLDDFSESCRNKNIPPHRVSANFSVYNVNKSQLEQLYVKSVAGLTSIGTGATIAPNRFHKTFYIKLDANTTYRFSLNGGDCVIAGASFLFHKEKPIPETIEKTDLIGGLRIKKKENIPNVGKTETIRYYYGDLNNLNKSSGFNYRSPWYVSNLVSTTPCQEGIPISGFYNYYTHKSLTSSSLRNLYESSSAFNTNYKYVTVSYGGDNFEKGGEQYEYFVKPDTPPAIVYGSIIENSPFDNFGWDNGLLKRKTLLKKKEDTFIKVQEVTNQYKRDNRFNDVVYGYTIKRVYELGTVFTRPDLRNLSNLDVMETRYRTNWFYMDRSEQKLYDDNGENPITSSTNYFYDNDTHLQLTRTETTDSNGLVLKTKTYYPDDVTSTSSLGHDNLTTTEKAAIDQLKTQNRIAEPIQVESYKNNVLQSTQRTNYKNFGGLYLPEFVQTAKGTSALEDRVVYHYYDNKGNPVEVSKKDGTKIYYVWGYQQTQPIAKIEGYGSITSAQQTAINNAITASNNDVSEATENTLRTRLETLRNSFTNEATQVTTFTYNPLVGVTSVTDPRGITMYYEYDAFNRLHLVKNSEGHIVKENEYHYKN
ncbi:hypothetical protein [Tenacibaculum sp. 190524A02b]|uniref:hypothetical protein n=1 Tax=Tenacibaculum vairaonense TaxID=3137860 RepID=UPI0031FB66CD